MTIAASIRQGTPAWEAARRSTIGSSDIAVIVGESPHKSAYTLAAEKLGLIPELIDDESRALMEIGHLMQPVLLQLYERETGRHPKGAPAWRLHPSIEWASASLDGTAPVRRVVEAKWSHSKRWRSGERVPGDVLVQVQWQLFVTGWDVADVVVLDFTTPRVEEVERDDALIGDLVYFATEFRGRLERGELPPLDGSASTAATLRARHPADNGIWLPATEDLAATVAQLGQAREAKREAEDAERNIASALRAVIGDATGILGLVSLKKNRDGERVNWPAVAGAYRAAIEKALEIESDNVLRGHLEGIDLDALQSMHTDPVEGARVLRLLSAKGEAA